MYSLATWAHPAAASTVKQPAWPPRQRVRSPESDGWLVTRPERRPVDGGQLLVGLCGSVPDVVTDPAATAVPGPAAPVTPAPLVLSTNGVDPVDLTVEFTRVGPLPGNLCVG